MSFSFRSAMWSPRFSGADDREGMEIEFPTGGCGRPDFGGGRQEDEFDGVGAPGMWSPRFRGADDRQAKLWLGDKPDVVAPISGADDRVRMMSGRRPADVVAPISGADNERNGRAGRGRSSLEAGGSNGPGHRIGTKNGIDDRRRTSAR